jgi:hypothetical protein
MSGRFERDGNPFAGETHPRAGGNGSLMRLAPIPLTYARQPAEAVRLAGLMSRTTHATPEPVDACRYYAGLIMGALRVEPRERLLEPRYTPVPGLWENEPLSPGIDALDTPGGGRIGMTFCPGKQNPFAMTGAWARDLDTDLAVIRAWGASTLVTLMEQ